MKKLYILNTFVLSLFIFPLSITAQIAPPIQWGIIRSSDNTTLGTCMAPLPDGGYISGGGNFCFLDDNGVIINKATNLNTIYTFSYSSGWYEVWSGLTPKPTPDGGFIITGQIRGNISDSGTPVITNKGTGTTRDATLIKYDSELNIEWIKNYGGTGNDYGTDVVTTTDEGYLVIGHTTSEDGDFAGIKNYGDAQNWYILKTDAEGAIEWLKTYGGPNPSPNPFDAKNSPHRVIQTRDGGYLVAGDIKSQEGGVTGHHGHNDIWVLKLDANGDITWQKTLGGSGKDYLDDSGGSIAQLPDESYIILGYTDSLDGDVSTFNGGSSDAWVIKLTKNGELAWEKTLGGVGTEQPPTYTNHGLAITPDGHIITLIRTGSNELSGYQTSGATVANILLNKLNSENGNVIWQRFLGPTGPSYENPKSSNGIWVNPGSIYAKPDGSLSLFGELIRQVPANIEEEPILPFSGPDVDVSFTQHNYTDTDNTVKWRVEFAAPCPEAPEAAAEQEFEDGDTLADLEVSAETGAELNWYTDEALTFSSKLTKDASLTDNTTYYVTQTVNNCESPATAITVKKGAMGISEVDKAALFSYYPNPVRDVLYFKGSENVQNVQIFDLSGKLIINQSAKTSLTQVSVAGLAKGVYVVRVKTDEQTRTFNIVKQ